MKKYKGLTIVLGAVFVQVCLGAIYSWSLYNQPLIDKFGWDRESVVLTYSIAIFVFAFTTIFSGRLYDRVGPRKVAAIGGLLYGTGMVLSAFVTELWQLYLTYGVIAGMGVGFAYVSPLTTCVKWFPKHRGLITGIAVGAFGSGSMIFKTFISTFLKTRGVEGTFTALGLIFGILVLTGAMMLRLPEEDSQDKKQPHPYDRMTLKDMVRTPRFYLTWFIYLLATMPGLLVIGLAKDIGLDMAGLTTGAAAAAVAIIALFNAGGRLVWGALSDTYGRITVVAVMLAITISSLLIMAMIPLNQTLYYICLIGVGFSFGGFLSVFPVITSDFFGMQHLGANYGIIFQAYGLAAILGPFLLKLSTGFSQTFLIAAAFAFLGLILTLVLKQHVDRKEILAWSFQDQYHPIKDYRKAHEGTKVRKEVV